ncbi:MAG: polyprenol monophosphomannose synthase [Cyclobacteriaceae bacterium]|nr:polyprenol monophosphomannose synthase [Cyclobacteriaceae bacterium]
MNSSLVIIPTYNECENIEPLLLRVFSLDIPLDVLVVDDDSPDGTADIVKKLQTKFSENLHLLSRQNKSGLGTAYIEGFQYALQKGYQYIFEMDADFSHNPKDLVRLYLTCYEEGIDLAIGSRYVTGVNVVNWPIGRVLMSYFASSYVRFITGMPIRDTTAGFKCYHRRVLETIDLNKIKFMGYAFQIEMKFAAWKLGFKIKEIPIVFTDRTRGESKLSKGIFKEAVFGVIKMKFRSLFGRKYSRD